MIRIDAAAIRRGRAAAGEVCEITGVGPIDVAKAVDLLGDATVRFLVKNGHDIASVATTTRYRPPELEVAVLEKGGWECANRTCSNTAYLEWEHEDDYARSRDTSYINGNPLCGCCHDRKTYDGWQIVHFADGTLELVPPDPPNDPDPP